MSLMAEQVVEEWLNRRGFFTIRGARAGTGEIDLLAIRPSAPSMECWQYEVQGSLRPVSYICAAPAALRKTGTAPYSAKRRQPEEMQKAVEEWINKKFHNSRKNEIRQRLYKGEWRFGLVLGNVKFPEEEQALREARIEIVKLASIISWLEPKKRATECSDFLLDAAGGNDFIELLWAHRNLKKQLL